MEIERWPKSTTQLAPGQWIAEAKDPIGESIATLLHHPIELMYSSLRFVSILLGSSPKQRICTSKFEVAAAINRDQQRYFSLNQRSSHSPSS